MRRKKWYLAPWVLGLLVIILPISESASSVPNYYFNAQSKYLGVYPDYGNCTYGNRSCTLYCDKIEPYLQAKGYSRASKWYDRQTSPRDLSDDYGNMRIWAGHGIDYTSPEGVRQGNESAAHFFNYDYNNYHPLTDHGNPACNVSWSEIRWGHINPYNDGVDYAVMYTCNFLNCNVWAWGNLNKLFQMFEGMHLMVGFASKMYINPDEGAWFGYYLQNNYTIKNAWITAAQKYQYQIGTTPTVYAAWIGHVNHENDTLAIHADPPWYINTFGTWNYAYRTYRVAN